MSAVDVPPLARARVAVVLPCFRVKAQILDVLSRLGPEVTRAYVVDDRCPEQSGDHVAAHCRDRRVVVLRHAENRGVGGAVMTGYAQALADGMDVVVKLDGDGQMDPALLPRFIRPLLNGSADYTKGNRFFDLRHIRRMPKVRLMGNMVLSFMTKVSTGYWNIFDPTNGYTALRVPVLKLLPLDKVSQRYFFETDLLFRLSTLRAVVTDIPMDAHYGDEQSSLRIGRVIPEFTFKHLRNFVKRLGYAYFLREVNAASLELMCGTALTSFGVGFGTVHWLEGLRTGLPTPTGTIMIATLTVLLGIQFLLAFLNFDTQNVPRKPIADDL